MKCVNIYIYIYIRFNEDDLRGKKIDLRCERDWILSSFFLSLENSSKLPKK
jgi:hypothetical protein